VIFTAVGGKADIVRTVVGVQKDKAQFHPLEFCGKVVRLPTSGGPTSILSTAYSHATHGENVSSFVAKLEFCGLMFGWFDKFLRNQLIKHGPLVRF
jgi:hypothetical protein